MKCERCGFVAAGHWPKWDMAAHWCKPPSLSWLVIDKRYPAKDQYSLAPSVAWDRDVIGEWHPIFVEWLHGLWAVDSVCSISNGDWWYRHVACRCLAWDGERWISRRAMELKLMAERAMPINLRHDPLWTRSYKAGEP